MTAAALLAREGRSVLVMEAAATLGGGARTEELTLPGFRHDVCSAIHPLAAGSPATRGPISSIARSALCPPLVGRSTFKPCVGRRA